MNNVMQLLQYKINYRDNIFQISGKSRKTDGDLIFFIHGLGCAKESFDNVWKYGEFNKYSILTIDLPGHGDSSKPHDFSYKMEEYAEILKKILRKYHDKNIHLVGHSMGGTIALLLIDIIPHRIKSFANIEGNLYSSDSGISRKAAALSYNTFKEILFNKIKVYAVQSENKGERLWASWIEKSDPYAFNKSSKSLVQWTDSGKLLQKFLKLKCRKEYFYGEYNSFMEVMIKIEGIKKTSISKSGHFPMNDNPNEFYRKLLAFIQLENST
ncbi:alpha/beta fold hydrolase [Spirochaetota bacterium]